MNLVRRSQIKCVQLIRDDDGDGNGDDDDVFQ